MAKGILPSSLPNQRKTAWNSYIWNTCFWVLLYSSKGKVKAAATIFCIRNKCNCRLIGLCQQWWGQYISTEFTLKEKGIGIILLKNYGSKHIYMFVFIIWSSMNSVLNTPNYSVAPLIIPQFLLPWFYIPFTFSYLISHTKFYSSFKA